MSDASQERLERLEMLLAEEALGQLDKHQQTELEELLVFFPDFDREGFQRAAAAMDVAFSASSRDQLPDSVKQRLAAQASSFIADEAGSATSAPVGRNGRSCSVPHGNGHATSSPDEKIQFGRLAFVENAASASNSVQSRSRSNDNDQSRQAKRPADPWRWAGWLVASAAVLALILTQTFAPKDDRIFADGDPDPTRELVIVEPASLTLEQQREQLLERPETKAYAWTPGPTPLDNVVQGDVVWNQQLQTGFMTFSGLPINDSALLQYQLWIIDPLRDKHPIDGGVFDISSSDVNSQGIAIVPIHAKLEVLDPQAFAVTIEKPGGVVVSDQSRLPLLAAVN